MQIAFLGVVFLVIVALLALRRPLYQAILGGLVFTVILYRIPALAILRQTANVFTNWGSLSVLVSLYLISFLQRMMESRSLIKHAQQDMNGLFHNRRVNAGGMPLFIGLLPSAAAMLLCGDIVKDATDGHLEAREQAFLTTWHVFGDVTVNSTGEILSNWEELKKKEKGQACQADAVDAVARSLPALWRAEKVQKKAAKSGFDWDDVSDAMDKLTEETMELAQAMKGNGDPAEELGDLLFAAVNVARFLEIDPEDALQSASDKFAARFRRVEEAVLSRGKRMEDMTLGELDDIWNQIKHQA